MIKNSLRNYLLLLVLGMSVGVISAQDISTRIQENNQNSVLYSPTAGGPFTCSDGNAYLVKGSYQNPSPDGHTGLYRVDMTANPFTYTQIGSDVSYSVNAIANNPTDDYIYGMRRTPNDQRRHLIKIASDGTFTDLGVVTGLPTGVHFVIGEITDAGTYYIKTNKGNKGLYKVNISAKSATAVKADYPNQSSGENFYDMAYDKNTDMFYSIDHSGYVISINPSNGKITKLSNAHGSSIFGGMLATSDGKVYGIEVQTGWNIATGFYEVDITNGQIVKISDAPTASQSDLAFCINSTLNFDTESDLSITKTADRSSYPSGDTIIYTITASNAGQFGSSNVPVSDPLPLGIPADSVSYTAVTSGGATTQVSGTQTGAINDIVGLPVGGTVTYTVKLRIPFGYIGNITNTATITAPTGTTDPDPNNNSASETVNVGPFNCADGYAYLVKGSQDTPSPDGKTGLFRVDMTTNPFTYTQIGNTVYYSVNAIGFNPIDGYIYGIRVTPSSKQNHLIQIKSDGSFNDLGPVQNLDPSSQYFIGAFDAAGNYYVVGATNDKVYSINVSSEQATEVMTLFSGVGQGFFDFAYNPVTGLFYTSAYDGQFYSLDLVNKVLTPIGPAHGNAGFGGIMTTASGDVYGIVVNSPSGSLDKGFYKFDITDGSWTKLSDAPAASQSDLAFCMSGDLNFDNKADLQVTKTVEAGPYEGGDTLTFTIVAENNGPFGVTDAPVNDPLPAGIPADSVSYTATASPGASTQVTGTQTGAITDVVDLPVGGTVTYTVDMRLPKDYDGSLTNIAEIEVPQDIIDNNTGNNKDTVMLSVNPLPITLLYFNAKQTDCKSVVLNWATASEINNAYILVQRSIDKKNWITVEKVDGYGNSSTVHEYSYTDTHSSEGMVYYRLKQVDFDGRINTAKIASVFTKACDNTIDLEIYPNPIKNVINIKLTESETYESIHINLLDVAGNVVRTITARPGTHQTIKVNGITSGIYFIRALSDNTVIFKRKVIISE